MLQVALLESLSSSGASRHFATIYDKGRNATINYLVMTLMGKSLQVLSGDLFLPIYVFDHFL